MALAIFWFVVCAAFLVLGFVIIKENEMVLGGLALGLLGIDFAVAGGFTLANINMFNPAITYPMYALACVNVIAAIAYTIVGIIGLLAICAFLVILSSIAG